MAPIPNDGSGNDDDTNSSEGSKTDDTNDDNLKLSEKKNILITKRVETKKLKKKFN